MFCADLASQIRHQGADHAAHRFMHEPARVDFGMLASDLLHVARENSDARELLDA